MPELGRYAFAVLMSYGIGISTLTGLIGLYLIRARRAKRALEEAEGES